ncbi:hypothetical protein Droror1_Dr00004245 [Drosera rotundifolia]
MEGSRRGGKSGPKPKRKREETENVELGLGISDLTGSKKQQRKRALKPWEKIEKEDKQWVKDFKDGKIERDQDNGVRDEVRELPPTLSVPLLPYRKEWLAWAVKKEDSGTKGGILLCYEMYCVMC